MSQGFYSPERAYRWGVLPIAVLLLVGGAWGLVAAALGSVGFVPFVHDAMRARLLEGGLGVASAIVAVGLICRSRVAWWASMACNALAHVWYGLGCLFDPGLERLLGQSELLAIYPPELLRAMRYFLFALLLVFGVVFTVGIYFATRPAFRVQRSPGR